MYFISCELSGRLGNNLFQIAHAYNQAIIYNRPFILSNIHRPHLEKYLDNILRNIQLQSTETIKFEKVGVSFHYSPVVPKQGHTLFCGFAQSAKYFNPNKEVIRKLFSPTEEFINKTKTANTTGIHIRRGDYLAYPDHHPTLSIEYINKALELFPNENYVVISDDLAWCRQNLKQPNITYFEGKDWECLWRLSLCDKIIISNSTFSWWSGFLAGHNNVLIPSSWFGPAYSYMLTTDIAESSWSCLQSKTSCGYILPNE